MESVFTRLWKYYRASYLKSNISHFLKLKTDQDQCFSVSFSLCSLLLWCEIYLCDLVACIRVRVTYERNEGQKEKQGENRRPEFNYCVITQANVRGYNFRAVLGKIAKSFFLRNFQKLLIRKQGLLIPRVMKQAVEPNRDLADVIQSKRT